MLEETRDQLGMLLRRYAQSTVIDMLVDLLESYDVLVSECDVLRIRADDYKVLYEEQQEANVRGLEVLNRLNTQLADKEHEVGMLMKEIDRLAGRLEP